MRGAGRWNCVWSDVEILWRWTILMLPTVGQHGDNWTRHPRPDCASKQPIRPCVRRQNLNPSEVLRWKSKLVVQHDAEEGALNRQSAVVAVVDIAHFPKLVHEMTDTRAGSAHHLCQVVLTDSGKNRFGLAILPKVSQQ